jgi:hypothetical protein
MKNEECKNENGASHKYRSAGFSPLQRWQASLFLVGIWQTKAEAASTPRSVRQL